MRLSIPDILKVQLVDDWENITKNNQVCPARPFVVVRRRLAHGIHLFRNGIARFLAQDS